MLATSDSSAKMIEPGHGHTAILYKKDLSQSTENLHLDAASLAGRLPHRNATVGSDKATFATAVEANRPLKPVVDARTA